MEETMILISAAVDAGGGSISWDVMLDAVPSDLRRHIKSALKALEAAGTYKREVRAVENGASFAIVKVQA